MSSSPSPTSRITGFVPAYNAAATIGEAVRSLREQHPVPLDVLVIDDASTDDTANIAERAGARVVRMPANSGRGAVRARAVELLESEFIVSVDAANRVPADFVTRALPLFDDPRVAAVVGHWWEPSANGVAQRWRARHLFKIDRQPAAGEERYLATHGCVLRRASILAAGNFSPKLRHTEDAVLGWHMQHLGQRIVGCPAARVEPQTVDALPALARRYWRWHAGHREAWSFGRYGAMLKNSALVMAPLDWRARDLPSLAFSLLLPHWLALYTLGRRLGGKIQK